MKKALEKGTPLLLTEAIIDYQLSSWGGDVLAEKGEIVHATGDFGYNMTLEGHGAIRSNGDKIFILETEFRIMRDFKEFAMGFADGYRCKLCCIKWPPHDVLASATYVYDITDEVWLKLRSDVTPYLSDTIEGPPKYIEDLVREGRVIQNGYSYEYISRPHF